MRRPAAATIDAVGVVVFAAIGRRSHDEGVGIAGVLATAAPFLLALGIGWVAVTVLGSSRPRFRDPVGTEPGAVIWAVTVALGLLARRTLWDRGTALAFVIVAAAFLAAALIGWRAATATWRAANAGD